MEQKIVIVLHLFYKMTSGVAMRVANDISGVAMATPRSAISSAHKSILGI